jgi:hypothetical protein
MTHFRATVRFLDLVGKDALAARTTLEERLRTTGIEHWRVLEISPANAKVPPGGSAAERWRVDQQIAAKILLLGALVWALWFFWILADFS